MRLKRLMSIVLAVALVMSFAMSASAASILCYTQDFEGTYADFWANVDTTNLISKFGTQGATYDIATFRTSGKVGTSGIYYIDAGRYQPEQLKAGFTTSANGYNQIEYNSDTTDQSFLFALPTSWNGRANETQSYIISFDLEATGAATNCYTYIDMVGNTGTDEAPAYTRARLAALYSGSYGKVYAHSPSPTYYNSGRYYEFTEEGENVRWAYKFTYDNVDGRLESITAVDGKNLSMGEIANSGAGSTGVGFLDTAGMYTIEGFGFDMDFNRPGISNIRAYSIDNTEGFKVTAPIGTKVTDLSSKVVTLTFTQPVSAASFDDSKVSLTANGSTVSGLIVGDIETGVVNGSYVSTVDVTLPALEAGKDYVLTVDDSVRNEVADSLTDNTISFSTPKPEITTTVPTITGNTVGSMSEASVAVTNNTESTNKNVAVIYAVYASGKLVDVVYANDTVAANTTATISAGVKLPAGATKAKVMVWDGLNTINPYTGFVSVDVAQ